MSRQPPSLAQRRSQSPLLIDDLNNANQGFGTFRQNLEHRIEVGTATNFPDGMHSPSEHLAVYQNQELFNMQPINGAQGSSSMNNFQPSDQSVSTANISANLPSVPSTSAQPGDVSDDGEFIPNSPLDTPDSAEKRSSKKKSKKKTAREPATEGAARRKNRRHSSQDEYLDGTVSKKRRSKKATTVPKVEKHKRSKRAAPKSKYAVSEDDMCLSGANNAGAGHESSFRVPVNDNNTGGMNARQNGNIDPFLLENFNEGYMQSNPDEASSSFARRSDDRSDPFEQTHGLPAEFSSEPFGALTSTDGTEPFPLFDNGFGLSAPGLDDYRDQHRVRDVHGGDIFGMSSQMNYRPQVQHTHQNGYSAPNASQSYQQSFADGINPHMNSFTSGVNNYRTWGAEAMPQQYPTLQPDFGASNQFSAAPGWGDSSSLSPGTLAGNTMMAEMDAGRSPTGFEEAMTGNDFQRTSGSTYQDFELYDSPNNDNSRASGTPGNDFQIYNMAFQQNGAMFPQGVFGQHIPGFAYGQSKVPDYQEKVDPYDPTAKKLPTPPIQRQKSTSSEPKPEPSPGASSTTRSPKQSTPYQPPEGLEAFGPAVPEQGDQEDKLEIPNIGKLIDPGSAPASQNALDSYVPYGRKCSKNRNPVFTLWNNLELAHAIQKGHSWVPPHGYQLAVVLSHQAPVTSDDQFPALFDQYIYEQCLWIFQRRRERARFMARSTRNEGELFETIAAEYYITFGIGATPLQLEQMFEGIGNNHMALFSGLGKDRDFLFWDFHHRKAYPLTSLPEYRFIHNPEHATNWLSLVDCLQKARTYIDAITGLREQAFEQEQRKATKSRKSKK